MILNRQKIGKENRRKDKYPSWATELIYPSPSWIAPECGIFCSFAPTDVSGSKSEIADSAMIFQNQSPYRSEGDHTRTMQLASGDGAKPPAADNAKALVAFRTAKLQHDPMLERLKALRDDHFETHPDEINWGHVGTLNHEASLLRQITDVAFSEGEHAA